MIKTLAELEPGDVMIRDGEAWVYLSSQVTRDGRLRVTFTNEQMPKDQLAFTAPAGRAVEVAR